MTDERSIPGVVREFQAKDGYVLKYRHYRPDRFPPRACVVGVHGIQSHSGWYEWSSSRLAAAGYEVFFLDRRGSGLNKRHRGHTRNWSLLCDDLIQMMSKIDSRREGFNRPIVIMSVSWGGKLAAALPEYFHILQQRMRRRNKPLERLFLRKDLIDGLDSMETFKKCRSEPFSSRIDGIVLLYPALFSHFDPSATQRIAIRTAQALGLGRKQVPIPVDQPKLFTGDPHWQQFIREDPLSLRKVSVSFLNATLKLTESAKQLPDRHPPPMFLALAGCDEMADLPKTRAWAARLPVETTRVIEYPDARHTLEFDKCREEFVADLIEWMESLVIKQQ